MVWWIVLAVAVVGFALAWWTSGRSRRPLPPGDDRLSRQGEVENTYGPSAGRGGFMPPS
jgi:hypothetical protein